MNRATNCLNMGISLSEWDSMTIREQEAFVQVHNEIQKARAKKSK